MISRCKGSGNTAYYYEGMELHPEWIESFESFLNEVGLPPTEKHELDRKDNNRGYVPGNVEWKTHKENMRNTRRAIFVKWNDEWMHLAHFCEIENIPYQRSKQRLKLGWSLDRIATTKESLHPEKFAGCEWEPSS